jgi:hypothetical protein
MVNDVINFRLVIPKTPSNVFGIIYYCYLETKKTNQQIKLLKLIDILYLHGRKNKDEKYVQ